MFFLMEIIFRNRGFLTAAVRAAFFIVRMLFGKSPLFCVCQYVLFVQRYRSRMFLANFRQTAARRSKKINTLIFRRQPVFFCVSYSISSFVFSLCFLELQDIDRFVIAY